MSDISKKMKVTEKSRPAPAVERPSYHSFVDMITNAVEDSKDSQGISLQAIKSYLKTNYDVDDVSTATAFFARYRTPKSKVK